MYKCMYVRKRLFNSLTLNFSGKLQWYSFKKKSDDIELPFPKVLPELSIKKIVQNDQNVIFVR